MHFPVNDQAQNVELRLQFLHFYLERRSSLNQTLSGHSDTRPSALKILWLDDVAGLFSGSPTKKSVQLRLVMAYLKVLRRSFNLLSS